MRIILGLIAFFILIVIVGCNHFNRNSYNITVTDKDRIIKGDDSYYVVFADLQNGQNKVFKNEDTLIEGKWNSSDIQGKLKVGEKYKIFVYGYRFPFLSMYENIIEVE